ncbi:MAG: hypothetical protein GEU81_16000 [Nitriliruptorales bacterium]|nr:hypothetical protein [Nitriliruptorales bacterium]
MAAGKAILDIPAERALRTAISMGYPADARDRRVSVERNVDTRQPLTALPVGRKPLSEIVHFDRYGGRDE